MRSKRRNPEFYKILMAGLMVLCFAFEAKAIDPNRALAQYIRERWGNEKGFLGGSVTAIAQTADGYLWIGTEKGLVRFDGLTFRAFPQATPTTFLIGPVQSLVADAQGNLWILLQSTKILRYYDGKFELGREEVEFGITSIARRKDGTVLFSSLALGTLTYRAGKFEVLEFSEASAKTPTSPESGDNLSSRLSWSTSVATHRYAEPNSAVISVAEGSDGKIWMGTQDKGLFYLKDGRISSATEGVSSGKINCLLPLENGELWAGTDDGVLRWDGSRLSRAGVPFALRHGAILSILRDRDENIWLGTRAGIVRFNTEGISSSESSKGVMVSSLFEDREGNLWVGTPQGIERIRDSVFVTYTTELPSQNIGPVYIDAEGRTWFAPIDGGLYWLKSGQTGSVSVAGLNKDVVYSIAGGRDGLWVGRQRGGLTHLSYADGTFTAQTYTQTEGLAQNSVYAVQESANGAIWAGTLNGGVSELKNGHFRTYTTVDGLASNTLATIVESRDESMWFATPNGLASYSHGKWRTFGSRDGLPSEDLSCLLEDSSGVLWIGSARGLAFLQSGHITAPREEPASLREPIFGIAEDKTGILWISTVNHVLRVDRDKLLAGTLGEKDVHEYGLADGLAGTEGVKRQQSVFAGPRGWIWFSMNHGLSVVDPVRASRISAPAVIRIESVSADGSALDVHGVIRVPAARHRITLSYAGLSLTVPERVRYRYRLEGFDRGWSDPGTTRETVYTNLPPGKYHFQVLACNSEGIWNKDPETVELDVLPSFYQTNWFLLLCFLVAGCVGLAGYEWRVRQMAARLDLQFEERLSERTRIARELHDTLLQSFQGLTLHFQKARNLLPERTTEAIQALDQALDRAERAIVEGRDAILDIRSPDRVTSDLGEELTSLGEQLRGSITDGMGTQFRVVIEGSANTLHPFLQVEIYRVAREAMRNAFGHARAGKVEVEIAYSKKLFRLRVRDNGKGIDADVLRHGERAGHWGLLGMRERAKRMGGHLDVWSEAGAGTEVELRVPGSIAYRVATVREEVEPFLKKGKPADEG
jgi:ligand-binding sensor domain-containing protein/signal transduction histidine kinase